MTVTLEKAPLDWTPKMNIDDDDDEDVESFEHNDDEDVHSYSGRWPGPIVKGSQRGKVSLARGLWAKCCKFQENMGFSNTLTLRSCGSRCRGSWRGSTRR